VALAAIREHKTTNELTTEFSVHATQISTWKKQVLDIIPEALLHKKATQQENKQAEIDEPHRQIGQLIAERDWFKKSP